MLSLLLFHYNIYRPDVKGIFNIFSGFFYVIFRRKSFGGKGLRKSRQPRISPVYSYVAMIVTANQTQPADKANHKIVFSLSFIFFFPLFNIF